MKTKKAGFPAESTSAKDFFLYLAFVVTLVWMIVSFFVGAFSLIDIWFPDTLDRNYLSFPGEHSLLLGSISSLLIVTPFFLIIAGYLNRHLRARPEKKDMWVRKWLLYLLLFIAFVTALVDLAWLASSFFQGGLTSRFIAKSLTVLAVSSAVFGYFLYDLRRDLSQAQVLPKLAGVGVGIVVFAVMIAGFVVAGSPSEQRARRFDRERLNSIEQMIWDIEGYIRENEELPETIEEMDYVSDRWRDPLTGEVYNYNMIDERSFEVCAVFERSFENSNDGDIYYGKDLISGPANFNHSAGEYCFEFKVRDKREADHKSSKLPSATREQ